MTTVQLIKQKGYWVGYNSFGHSGYGRNGSDIVCASISTAVQMTAMGIKDVLKIKAEIEYCEEPAKFCLNIIGPKEKAQDMLEMLYLIVQDIQKEYPKYVKLEVIEKC